MAPLLRSVSILDFERASGASVMDSRVGWIRTLYSGDARICIFIDITLRWEVMRSIDRETEKMELFAQFAIHSRLMG